MYLNIKGTDRVWWQLKDFGDKVLVCDNNSLHRWFDKSLTSEYKESFKEGDYVTVDYVGCDHCVWKIVELKPLHRSAYREALLINRKKETLTILTNYLKIKIYDTKT